MAASLATVSNFLEHPLFLHLEQVSKIFKDFAADLDPIYDRVFRNKINPLANRSAHQEQLERELLLKVENELYKKIAPTPSENWLEGVDTEVIRIHHDRCVAGAVLNDKGFWMFRAIRNSIEHFENQRNVAKFTAMYDQIGNKECSFLVHIIQHRKQLVPATTKFILENAALLPKSSKILKELSPSLPPTISDSFDDIIENFLDMLDEEVTGENLLCQFETLERASRGYVAFVKPRSEYTLPKVDVLITFQGRSVHFSDGNYNWSIQTDTTRDVRIVQAHQLKEALFCNADKLIFVVQQTVEQCTNFLRTITTISPRALPITWNTYNQNLRNQWAIRELMIYGKTYTFADIFLSGNTISRPETLEYITDNVLPSLLNSCQVELLWEPSIIPTHYISQQLNLSLGINILHGRPLIGKSFKMKIHQNNANGFVIIFNIDLDHIETESTAISKSFQNFLTPSDTAEGSKMKLIHHLIASQDHAVHIVLDGAVKPFTNVASKRKIQRRSAQRALHQLSTLVLAKPKTSLWLVTRSRCKNYFARLLENRSTIQGFPDLSLDDAMQYLFHAAQSSYSSKETFHEQMNTIREYFSTHFQINSFVCESLSTRLIQQNLFISKYNLSKFLENLYYSKAFSLPFIKSLGERLARQLFVVRHAKFAFNYLINEMVGENVPHNDMAIFKREIESFIADVEDPIALEDIDHGLLRLDNVEDNVCWDTNEILFYDATMPNYFLALSFLICNIRNGNRSYSARAQILHNLKRNKISKGINYQEVRYYFKHMSKESNYTDMSRKIKEYSDTNLVRN